MYPIHTILRKDYKNIEPNITIFLCIYQINKLSFKPFLQYTLWKYTKFHDLLIFPYCKNDRGGALKQINILKNKINKENVKVKGFLKHNEAIYMFAEDILSLNKLNIKYRKKKKWWVTIDEICNHRNLLKFPIHHTVTDIFFKFPTLIHLINKDNTKIEIPYVAYNGDYSQLLPMTAVFGTRKIRSSIMGPFYYFGDYNAAIRYAGWSSGYSAYKINNKAITDKEGKWKSGGIIRSILFLGKCKILLNHDEESVNNKKSSKCSKLWKNLIDRNGTWSESYDSLYIGRAPLSNGYVFRQSPQFVIKKFKQQHCLSIHYIDRKTLRRTWEPTYDKYYIS